MEIGVWLHKLGLGRYEAIFRENFIDSEILLKLTPDDLKDLGVTIVGHRRLLLDEIDALKNMKGTSDFISSRTYQMNATVDGGAERRQVSILFVDLVGSTALANQMDPEDARKAIIAYQNCAAKTFLQHRGFIAQFQGDGILVCFGYPEAHEDDAERAVQAGLDIVASVSALKTSVPLQTRVGIATGLVVIGDLIGTGESQTRGIVGGPPNLAVRLKEIADPNTVMISDSTRRLIGDLFALRSNGSSRFKGFSSAIDVWTVLHSNKGESRFEALHSIGLTDLVGRVDEVATIMAQWKAALSANGHVVLVRGEAGIGKSRLIFAVTTHIREDEHIILRFHCSPQHVTSAYYPFINQIERSARFLPDDSMCLKLDKLDALLARTGTSTGDAALLAEMIGVSNDGRYPRDDYTPHERRKYTLTALVRQVETLSRSTPLMMIYEDAHWMDATSLEALGQIVDAVVKLRALIIVTCRSELDAPWLRHSHVNMLALRRFTVFESGVMVDNISGKSEITVAMKREIVERTDGIPLFIEEMTKAVMDVGNGAADRRVSAIPPASASVPATLYASLMARLDRLGPAKEITQIAAAIGRDFSFGLLQLVINKSAEELVLALDKLVDAGLLIQYHTDAGVAYSFNHVLVQEAAYNTMLRATRTILHARIAKCLEIYFRDISEHKPEVLARHYAEAGLTDQAARLWGRAGLRSLRNSALIEAKAQLALALKLLETLPGDTALRQTRIELQTALITPMLHVIGYAAPETKTAVERAFELIEEAEALAEPPSNPLLFFSALYGLWTVNYVSFDGPTILRLAGQFMARAEEHNAGTMLSVANRLIGISLTCTGDVERGKQHFDKALQTYEARDNIPLAILFGVETGVSILSYRSLALWLLGYPDAATRDSDRAVDGANRTGQAATIMYSLTIGRLAVFLSGNYQLAKTETDTVIALAEDKGAVFWNAFGVMNKGWLSSEKGNYTDAVVLLSSGIAAWRSAGGKVWVPLYLTQLSWSYAKLGQWEASWSCLREAQAAIGTTHETWCQAEVHRVAGEVSRLAGRDHFQVKKCFQHALSVSQQQKAKAWELRAAISLGQFLRDEGNFVEAYDVIHPVSGWFSEGFSTPDLIQANTLLAEIGQVDDAALTRRPHLGHRR